MRNLLMATAAAWCLTAAVSAHAQDVLMTGGKTGDYYNVFAPPLVKVLDRAWVDVTVEESAGTPANMAYVKDHPLSYAIVQGNAYAGLLGSDPRYKDQFQILSSAIGSEAVLAIMNEATWRRSEGSWAAIARHASQVRFAMPPKDSGPGYTFEELQQLDPGGLGKATRVTAYNSLDEAIRAVAAGQADVTLMVQFANPDNARFKLVKDSGLHFAPVISGQMKGLEIPGGVGPAFKLCEGVQVTHDETLTTACSPILAITGASNTNADLHKVFAGVSPEDFQPHQSGFAALWHKVKVGSATAWDKAAGWADQKAAEVSDKM